MQNGKSIAKEKIIPSGISTFRLEANRSRHGMCLNVSGIIGISDFSEERVVLLSHFGKMTVCGQRLFINLYEGNSIELHGKAEEISFRYGKN